MGKKDKAGFNSPFAKLKLEPKAEDRKPKADDRRPTTDGRSPKTGDRSPTTGDRNANGISADEADEFLRAVGGAAPIVRTKRVEPEKRLASEQPDDDALALAELQALVEGDTPFHVV